MVALLDTHQHLLYANDLPYSWTADFPALAGRAFTLEDYKRGSAGRDIKATLFMEADVDEARRLEEAPFIAAIAKQPGSGLAGLISNLRPENDSGFEAELERADELGIVGFRRILHVMGDPLSQSSPFRGHVRKLGAAGKTFDMCFLARQLPVARDLAKACENTRLILDHCGVPDIAGGGLDPWRADISALAALPNVTCKLSGLLAYCRPDAATLDSIRPYVDHVLEAFGPQRMIWGSDWPVVTVTSDLPTWIDITQEILGALSPDEAEAIGSANAVQVYGLDG
ncbi:MAG: amidohydrolase family protein [Pseudomonadota bacterium]